MAITDINISETLDVGAPSIKYTGNMDPNSIPPWERDSYIDPADDVIDEEATIKVASNESNDAWLENRIEELMEMGLDWGAAASQASKELREGNVGPQDLASGGRVNFGLGSIFKSIGKAAKKAVKSPVGKMALLGGLGYLSNAGMLPGGAGSGWFSKFKPWMFGTPSSGIGALSGQGPGLWSAVKSSTPGLLGKLGLTKGAGSMMPTALGWGTAALGAGMGAQMFENMSGDEITDLKNDPEALRAYLKQYHSNTNPDKSEEEVDIWVEQNMYSTGGRVGLASGANEKFEEKIAALVAKGLTRELAEAIVLSDISPDNFKIIDALENKADGGRIGYSDRGVVSLEQGKESIWNKRENPERHYEMVEKPILDKLDYIYSLRPEAQVKLKDEIKALKLQLSGDAPQFAQGGRIGFAYGPDQTAEAAGIMGQLPVRKNGAGVKELDLRDSGGFIPPVGVKEKADDIPAMLSNNEFVMTADAVRAAGGGSVEKGAQVMYDQMKQLENKVA